MNCRINIISFKQEEMNEWMRTSGLWIICIKYSILQSRRKKVLNVDKLLIVAIVDLVLYSSKVEMLSHVTHCFSYKKHEQVKNVTYKFPVLFSTDTSQYLNNASENTRTCCRFLWTKPSPARVWGQQSIFSLICTIQQPDFLLYWTDKSLRPDQCSDVLWSHVLVEVVHLV